MVGTPGSSEPSGMVKCLPSGKRLQFAIENGPVEIVDLPIENGDFPQLCKRLPGGNAWGLDPINGIQQSHRLRRCQSITVQKGKPSNLLIISW